MFQLETSRARKCEGINILTLSRYTHNPLTLSKAFEWVDGPGKLCIDFSTSKKPAAPEARLIKKRLADSIIQRGSGLPSA